MCVWASFSRLFLQPYMYFHCNNLIAFVHDLLTTTTITSNMSDQFCYSTIYRKLNCQDSLSLYFIMDINNTIFTTGKYWLEFLLFLYSIFRYFNKQLKSLIYDKSKTHKSFTATYFIWLQFILRYVSNLMMSWKFTSKTKTSWYAQSNSQQINAKSLFIFHFYSLQLLFSYFLFRNVPFENICVNLFYWIHLHTSKSNKLECVNMTIFNIYLMFLDLLVLYKPDKIYIEKTVFCRMLIYFLYGILFYDAW